MPDYLVPSDLAYQLREQWTRLGPPVEVFIPAGEFYNALRKNGVPEYWSGIGKMLIPVMTNLPPNTGGAAYERTYALYAPGSGDQFKVPIREAWATDQRTWLHYALAETAGATQSGKSGDEIATMLAVQGYHKHMSYTVLGDGTGRIAKGDGAWTITGDVITLKNKSQINRFEVGDVLRLIDQAAAVPASGRPTPRTGTVTIESINEGAGTINTVEANISAAITGTANTDYIAKSIDFEGGGETASTGVVDGYFRWNPITATEAATVWAEVTRANNVARLSGRRITLTGAETPWQIAVKIAKEAVTKGLPITIIYYPAQLIEAMAAEMEARSINIVSGQSPTSIRNLQFGYSRVTVQVPGMPPFSLVPERYLSDSTLDQDSDYTFIGFPESYLALEGAQGGINWQAYGTDGKRLQLNGIQATYASYGGFYNLCNRAAGHCIVASTRASA